MSEQIGDGFPEGSGIFETIKTVGNRPIALGRHMRRALESAQALGITMPDEESIRRAILDSISSHPQEVGRLRLCFSVGKVDISHEPYSEKIDPARLTLHSTTVKGSMYKSYPYTERFALLKSANDEGFDDCILFNNQNQITESSVANLIFRIKGQWVTPPISAGILPGVMRALAVEECGVKVQTIHISEIPDIASGFIISSLRIAQPVSHIGEMRLQIDDAVKELERRIRASAQPLSVG